MTPTPITGRAKDVIIRSSHNLDPEAIEEALLRHPQVQMAAAVGEPFFGVDKLELVDEWLAAGGW